VRQRESAVVAKSAPDASTKPLARALRKFAAQRDYLTISVIQTGSSQKVEPGRTVLHVLCQASLFYSPTMARAQTSSISISR
jgi:hypothetical protein